MDHNDELLDDGLFEIDVSDVLFDGQQLEADGSRGRGDDVLLQAVHLDDLIIKQEEVVLDTSSTSTLAEYQAYTSRAREWARDPFACLSVVGFLLALAIMRFTLFRRRDLRKDKTRTSEVVVSVVTADQKTVEAQFAKNLSRLESAVVPLARCNDAAARSYFAWLLIDVYELSDSCAQVVSSISQCTLTSLVTLERLEGVITSLVDAVRTAQRALHEPSYMDLDLLRDNVRTFESIADAIVALRRGRDVLEQNLYVAGSTRDPSEEATAALQAALTISNEESNAAATLTTSMAAFAEAEIGDKASALYLQAAAKLEEIYAAEDDLVRQQLARREQNEMKMMGDAINMTSAMLTNSGVSGGTSANHPFASLIQNGSPTDQSDQSSNLDNILNLQVTADDNNSTTVTRTTQSSQKLQNYNEVSQGQSEVKALVVSQFAIEFNKVRRDIRKEEEQTLAALKKSREAAREKARDDAKTDTWRKRELAQRHRSLQEQRATRSTLDGEFAAKWRREVLGRHAEAKSKQSSFDFYYLVVFTNFLIFLAFGVVASSSLSADNSCALVSELGDSGVDSRPECAPPSAQGSSYTSLFLSLAGQATGRATLALVHLFRGWDAAWLLHDLTVCAIKVAISVFFPVIVSRVVSLVHRPTGSYLLLMGVAWTLWQPAAVVFASLWQTCFLALANFACYYVVLGLCDVRLTWSLSPTKRDRGFDFRTILVYLLMPLWLVSLSTLLACQALTAGESSGLHIGHRFTWASVEVALKHVLTRLQ